MAFSFQCVVKAMKQESWIRRGSRLVQCPRAGIVDMVRTNLLQWGGWKMIVELQQLSAERLRYTIQSLGFPSACLS